MTLETSPEVAFMERLHHEHAAELRGYCLRLTGFDRPHTEDVLQETFLRALNHAATLDGSHGSVRAWLRTVARNIVVDEWRTARAHHELPVADVPDRAQEEGAVDALVLSWVVADALTRLSRDHREVLVECYFRGASVATAAHRLGVPSGTVKSRTHYALRALRLTLEEMGVTG